MSTELTTNPMPGRRALLWSLAAGLASAAFAGWFLERFVHEVSGGERVRVLRALAPIERGTLLRDELLVEASVPASYVEARAVRAADRARIRGVRTAMALDTQDALLWSDLAAAQQNRDLSSLIQPGNRAVPIAAALADAEALIRPGDYVDVLASLSPPESYAQTAHKLVSVVLLQRVLILAVGSVTDPQLLRAEVPSERAADGGRARLTLSLKVEEGQLLALAQERGKLSVMLRRPDDTRVIEDAPELPLSNLYDAAFRKQLQQRRRPEPRPVRLTASVAGP